MGRIRKLFSLPATKRRLLLAAVTLLAAVRLLLCLLPFAWVRAALRPLANGSRRPQASQAAHDISWAIDVASRVVPKGTHCLSMALVAQTLLFRHGCTATLHFGVPRESGSQFIAHAWVKSNGVVVSGGPGVDRDYIELTR